MRAALDIAIRDLRARLRDRSALITAFIAPIGLAVILSLALGSTDEISITIGLVDLDEGQLGEGIVEAFSEGGADSVITITELADEDALRAALDAGEADAGLIVPAGTIERAQAGEQAQLRVLREPGSLSGDLAAAVARGVGSQLERARQVTELAARAGAPPQVAGGLIPAVLEAEPLLSMVDQEVEGSLTSPASYFGPAMAVFFVFFVVGSGPQSLLAQRREGSLARLAAAPIPRWSILVGTGLSVLVLALASICTLWLVMYVAFGASWGDPAGVLVLALAITLAAAAITTLVATAARTEEQVNGFTSIVVFTLALLGGSFGPLPQQLEPLSLATPNGLVLRGFVDLAAGGGLDVVVVPLLGALAFTVVALAIALPRANRLVQP